MDKEQLRQLITSVLSEPDVIEVIPFSEDAVELLMLTAAVESHLGKYIYQLNGPARGIFQMEPATEKDIHERYLFYHKPIEQVVKSFMCPGIDNLAHNLEYQVLMARVFYRRVKEALPKKGDVEAMAQYHKKYYNTYLGKSTVEKTVAEYNRRVRDNG